MSLALRTGALGSALLSGVYGCGRKLFGRKSGWCAAVVLATFGSHYALSRTANLDMVLSALITAALISFLLGTREPLGKRW